MSKAFTGDIAKGRQIEKLARTVRGVEQVEIHMRSLTLYTD